MNRQQPSRIEQVVGDFRRVLVSQPGFPLDPVYGQHGMDLRFVLVGELGATQFLMYTDWVPGKAGLRGASAGCFPMAADLGHHWKVDPHAGQYDEPWGRMDECEWFSDGCWYDGSGLNAEPVMRRFFAEGMDAVWADLEQYYTEVASWGKQAES